LSAWAASIIWARWSGGACPMPLEAARCSARARSTSAVSERRLLVELAQAVELGAVQPRRASAAATASASSVSRRDRSCAPG
jgi:hypothetical protein